MSLLSKVDGTRGESRGYQWEARVTEVLTSRGLPVVSVPGGLEIYDVLPASRLRHQLDGEIGCSDAYVIGEWKAFRLRHCYNRFIP